MKNINSRNDVLNSKEIEVKQFFNSAIFRGEFKALADDEQSNFGWACGKVIDISINGQINDLCPKILYVPTKFSAYVTNGLCEFSAIVDSKALHAEKPIYKLLIVRIKNATIIVPNHNDKEEQLFRRNLKLRNNRFVGQFLINSDGSVKICDIRRPDFSKLILQNGKEQSPIVYHPKLFKPISGRYYEFTWILNVSRENYVYLFKVDESQPLKEVTPQDLVKRLHDDIMDYPAGAGQKIVRMLDTLKNQLTASGKEIFIYELLQNANDYPVIIDGVKQSVDVEFHLTLSSLVFMHTGAAFNEKNIAAICSINDKEKDTNKDTIGYKGIGFKTVFLDNENVYLQTAGYSFRFDKQATKDIVDTPWQILPIWTKFSELTPAERAIFTQASREFNVKFALRPTRLETLRSITQSYEQMFRTVFSNERVILFIPNLANVRVYLQGTSTPDIICCKSNNNWRVDDFEDDIDESITASINGDIDEQENQGGLKIPTKYYNFRKTKVSFACEVDNQNKRLKPVTDTCLYCYLPAKEAKWGLKFLMNTDMIPNGARDNIETEFDHTTNVNEEIARIAGSKLFDWIYKLCSSNLYEYNSVFNLIPNFSTIKRGRDKFKELISDFQNGFEERLKDGAIIPSDGGFLNVIKTILDETGITSSGILTDEEFLQFLNIEEVGLPDLLLRPNNKENEAFHSFLKNYLEKFDAKDNIFDIGSLTNMVQTDSFKDWLKIQNNNDKFLNFLLEKDYLKDFLCEEIFLGSDGDLYNASGLYYDIDKYLVDLEAFTDQLRYLSAETRIYFAGNSKWQEVIDAFITFNADKFVDGTLLNEENIDTTIARLKDFGTSIHFFNFLAEYVCYADSYKGLPFFDEKGDVVEDFHNKFIFFHDKDGETLCSCKWLVNVATSFINESYSEKTKLYFKNFEALDYSDDFIIKNIILSEDFRNKVSDAIADRLEVSIDFINFCFKNRDIIPLYGLKSYTLSVYDCEGNSKWYLNENDVYFPSSLLDYYSRKEWIDPSWLTCLNDNYFPNKLSEKEYKQFFTETFGIVELTDESFYKNIVRNNLVNLFIKIKGNQDKDGHKNIDFIKYLDANYNLIFEEENDAKLFSELVIASEEGVDVNLNKANLYIYDSELAEIIDFPWFPDKVIAMTHHGYGMSKSLEKLGVARYSFADFYDSIIVGNLNLINNLISTVVESVAFHNFIIEHKNSLLDEQVAKMKNAKVFLYGVPTPSLKGNGHNILSQKANELFKLGLVECESLDLIAPEYNPDANIEYWENRLGNSKFTIGNFASWLRSHRSEFETTLKDKTKNIAFWRWLKNNQSESLLKEVVGLPILLSNGSLAQSEVIFFSDAYLGELKIETTVQRFNKTAHFLSPSYIEDGDDVLLWKDFFSKLRVKFEIADILIDTIDNSLSTVDDRNLIKLITDNREALENHYADDLISHLHSLRVQAKDGNFYSIGDAILINCESEEPFAYITIPNQISFSYPKENRLIDDLMQDVKGIRIQSLKEWKQLKIDYYLTLQDTDTDKIRSIHFRFINDLAKIRNSNAEALTDYQHIDKIKVLDRHNAFRDAMSLTIGSSYNPFFDFEKCGVAELEYVSDEYNVTCSEYVGRLFRTLNMHRDFIESDIKYLSIRSCSIYFWTVYLEKQTESDSKTKIASIKSMICEHKFDNVSCIPTKDYMKRPSELYYGKEVDKYIDKIEDWENKTPLTNLPEIRISESGTSLFESLPFKESLDFLDALYALFNVQGKEFRPQLLKWLIEGYDSSYMQKIQEYRDDELAIWKNSQGEKVQIKELYALEYGNRKLEQYFGTNPKIINKDYFPVGEAFRSICDILQIKTITNADFSMDPVNDTLCSRYNSDLRLFVLIIAGIISIKDWNDIYARYCTKLDALKLHRCDSILIKCNFESSISQDFKQLYHEEGAPDFYFVDDIYDPLVFLDFVNEFITYLGINDIEDDLVKLIMHNRDKALQIVQTHHDLIVNEEFKTELISLAPQLKNELCEKEEEYEDDVATFTRPEFTISIHTTPNEHVGFEDKGVDHVSSPSKGVDSDEYQKDTINEQSTGTIVINDFGEAEEPQSDNSEESSITCSRDALDSAVGSSTPNYIQTGEDVDIVSGGESPADYVYDTEDVHIGSVNNDLDYNKLGEKPTRPRSFGTVRRHPKPYTTAEVNRMRSNPSPLALESLPPTSEELEILSQMDITPEQIADTNYLAQLRLYQNLISRGDIPEEDRDEFVRNAADVTTHRLKSGKYIHTCSAARGVMYISPSVWDKMLDDRWEICVYLDGKGSKFHFIKSKEEFLKLVEKDDVVIKVTGQEKVDVVNQLYSNILNGVKGTAYTLIRVASTTNMDAVFAHYIGSMAEKNDGNNIQEDIDDYGS